MSNVTDTAYNLWARSVDRPAEWWFSGRVTVFTDFSDHFLPLRLTPDVACRCGYEDKVLATVIDAVERMKITI